VLPVTDLGLTRGFAVFDYLRTYQGRPFHLWDHLLRLQYSAKQIGLEMPKLEYIQGVIHELLKRNSFPESAVKIMVTGGQSSNGIYPDGTPSLVVLVWKLPEFPASFYEIGVKTATTRLSRLFGHAKTTNYVPAIMGLKAARAQGASEALYVDEDNNLLEATTLNFFALVDGVWHTPASIKLLYGITRAVVLRLTAESGVKVVEGPVNMTDLKRFQEAFICSSGKDIVPCVQIDDHVIQDGKPGPQTRKLIAAFKEYAAHEDKWAPLHIHRHED